MTRVAIVGVEGSGKTVLLAGLGDLYSHPDNKGYFLSPKNFRTASYVVEKIAKMREGSWPAATAEDVMQGLDWTLRRKGEAQKRPTDICEISCLDFAGEIYRKAFVESDGPKDAEQMRQIEKLWDYVARADVLIVLVNLSDVIARGAGDRRVQEAMWVTDGILEQALKERADRVQPRAAIVLSQSDRYSAVIRECGGAKATIERYLPLLANSFGWLDVFEASTVDKTRLDDDGMEVPAHDFTMEGLRPIMKWIVGDTSDDESSWTEVIATVALATAVVIGIVFSLLMPLWM
jgi:hypothetical protein